MGDKTMRNIGDFTENVGEATQNLGGSRGC